MNELLQLSKLHFQTIMVEQGSRDLTDPSSIINNMTTTVIGWALNIVTGFATLNFILAMFSYMSNNPQTQMQGTDKMKRVCIAVVGAFSAKTIMNILEAQAKQWS